MKLRPTWYVTGRLPAIAGSVCFAQWRCVGRRFGAVSSERYGVPEWTIAPGCEQDSFVFARVRYASSGDGRGGGWDTDYRDADLNLSLRLHQLTSLQADPEGKVIDLTDPDLFNYPFAINVRFCAMTH